MNNLVDAQDIQLGLGLIQLGRPWGTHPERDLPSDTQAAELILAAVELGVTVFDTAPAYGTSEERLGKLITQVDPDSFLIATKAGEEWDADSSQSIVNHSLEFLTESVERSLKRLGRIDILQIHKCTVDVVDMPGVHEFTRMMRDDHRIGMLGASVSDVSTAERALESGLFDCLQFPLNAVDQRFADLCRELETAREMAIVNRPFHMGKAEHSTHSDRVSAFALISKYLSRGVILTGTSSPKHLADNARAFAEVFR